MANTEPNNLEEDYSRFLIEDRKHWQIYLHQKQYYLGRTYIWAKRKGLVDLFDITYEEGVELLTLGRELKSALSRSFDPDLFNQVSQGNVSTHLHLHVIPRYKDRRVFELIEFKDERWGKNYAPYNYDFNVDENVLMKIKEEISKYFKNPQSHK